MIRWLHQHCRQLLYCERGSVFVLMAAALFMLITVTGVAVDMARLQTLEEKISSSLDAAGLAAGTTAASAPSTLPSYCTTLGQTTWVGCQAQKYFNANFPSGYLSSGPITVSATLSSDLTTISLNASTTQNTTIMQAIGVKTMAVAAASTIARKVTGMELVLVLDNTGSMSDPVNPADSNTPKITALKNALTNTGGLLDILYGSGNDTASNLWVGVVPFTYMVNIGTNYSSWIDTSANSDFGPVINGSSCPTYSGTSPVTNGSYYSNPNRCIYAIPGSAQSNFGLSGNWAGCVDARSKTAASPTESPMTLDETDDIPSASVVGTLFPPFYNTSPNTNISGTAPSYACSRSSDWYCYTNSGSGSSATTYNVYYPVTSSTGPNVNCIQTPVLPMTASRTNVENTVGSMSAGGSTMINLGMVWSWRLLSPNWRAGSTFSGWGGEMATATTVPPQSYTGLPLNYNTPNMNKVVVLMTDGMNSSSSGGAYQGQSTPSNTQLDNATLAICTAMKNNGIIIYTIGFGTTDNPANSNSSTYVDGTLLKACASKNSYYFLAPTNAELATAFQTIGSALSNLRVSQ